MSKKQLLEYPVTVEFERKRYTGFYTVSFGFVSVESDWAERRTHAGPKAAHTARLLEILRNAQSRGELIAGLER